MKNDFIICWIIFKEVNIMVKVKSLAKAKSSVSARIAARSIIVKA
ncbi:hypothetical protein [Streptococcus suis]|nr:hypothetical protein [Streptococcus suis]